MTDAFDAIKEQMRSKHEGFIALLMVLREHGLSADVAATVALQLPARPEECDAAPDIIEACARRVDQGHYDIPADMDNVKAIVVETVRQACDKIRCGLKA